MSINSKSLPQKKCSIWLESTGKVFCFCTKILADDPGTFVGNGGYHFDVGSVLSILAPTLADGVAKERRRDRCQARDLVISAL